MLVKGDHYVGDW